MARILLPTDFSDASLHAAQYAVKLFGARDNTFMLLHTYMDLFTGDPIIPSLTPELMRRSEEGMAAFAEGFCRTTDVAEVSHVVLSGPVVNAVNDRVRQHGDDIVVMGRAGTGGSALLGSNTVDVVKHCDVPVLVVPAQQPIAPPRTILLADDHDDMRVRDFAMLRVIALLADARVLVAHVAEDGEVATPHWSAGIYELALAGVQHDFVSGHDMDPTEGLHRLAHRKQADMVAVLHRHTNLLEGLIHHSTAKELVMYGDLPVLVMQHRGS